MRKNILDLNNTECKKFLLEQKQYTTLDLPPYFAFDKTLTELSKIFRNKHFSHDELKKIGKNENVNHVIYGNKDGKYAWRKYEIINPLLYLSLVNVLCAKANWKKIKQSVNNLKCNGAIKCLSVPVLRDKKRSQKASQINEWIEEVERESVRLALDYEYVFQTDISDCYGSIYTHSLAWALHGKTFSKTSKGRGNKRMCGNLIDWHLQAMANGQTNGIPQGSIVMDLIAEILLSYTDRELYKKTRSQLNDDSYKILRYRDDYRIFVRERKHGDLIIKTLSEVLIELGLHLNTEKTTDNDEVILASVRHDKTDCLHLPMFSGLSKQNLRNEILLTYELAIKYPNSGMVLTRLNNLYKDYEDSSNKHFYKQEDELLSILANIALYNPKSFSVIAAFISKIIKYFDGKRKNTAINSILRKFSLIPNSGLLEIWLQRIAIPNSIKITYKDKLCKKVNNNRNQIFNTSWILDKRCKNILEKTYLIDKVALDSIDVVISSDEINLFKYE